MRIWMKRDVWIAALSGALILALLPLTNGCRRVSQPRKLVLAYNSWVGFAPMFVAQDRGFFRKEGVELDLRLMEDTGAKGVALKSGDIDGVGTTVDSFVIQAGRGVPGKIMMAFDQSNGADGIVAIEEIRSIEDLPGHKVALQPGFVGHFFLLYLLDEAGIEPSSVTIEPMETGAAGAAFVAGKVDAAVTWEPWLSKARERQGAHVLVSSREEPGVIVDVFVMRPDVLAERRSDVLAFMRGWYHGLEYLQSQPDEALPIVARVLHANESDVKEMLEGVKFMSLEENLQYFGTREEPGFIDHVVDVAARVWREAGFLERKVDASTIVDPDLLTELEAR